MQQTTSFTGFKRAAIRRRRFSIALTAHVIALLIPVLVLGAAAPLRVKIGTASISSSTLNLWIAQDQALFSKHGIEAQTILVRGGPTLVSSLVAGDIDVAFTTGVSILGAAAQGADVKMLTSLSDRVSWKLIAAPQIRKAQDLRGKRIGVQSIVGSTWMNSMLALEQLGLEPRRDNIAFLAIGDPVTMAHALEAGRVDAAVLDPVMSRGLIGKNFSLLVDLLEARVSFPGLGVGVTRAYLQQHVALVERLVAALTESLAFIHAPANKEIVLKSLMKNLRSAAPAAAEEGYQDQLLTLNRKPYPSLEGLRNAQRLMALQNPRVAALKITDLIDSSFVRKLDESGGIDRLYNNQQR